MNVESEKKRNIPETIILPVTPVKFNPAHHSFLLAEDYKNVSAG
jgi:hypothetical protein